MSGLYDWIRLTIAVLLLVVAHFVLRPLLGDRIEIDFLVLALLLMAIRVRPGVGAVLGLLMGAASDAASPAGFGSAMLALTIVGYVTSWLKAAFFAENAVLDGVVIFASAWGVMLTRLLLSGRSFETGFAVSALVWAPLSAAATALVGAVLFTVLRPLLKPASA
ncbi:MAG: rod shape-determining protein MreD [Gemmatimonadaceae bacterium]|nr:rod shape-determining protein MreD [Gemmatimonadaceae bacterium]